MYKQKGKRFMDLKKEALACGFADAAVIDVKDLVFVLEYRKFCEENLCGNYNLLPACPPACGTAEEMRRRAQSYERALILQSILKQPEIDSAFFKKAKREHNLLTEKLAGQMKTGGMKDLLIMSAGPYKRHSCMSAYGVDAQKMADAAKMVCWADDGDVRLFSLILF